MTEEEERDWFAATEYGRYFRRTGREAPPDWKPGDPIDRQARNPADRKREITRRENRGRGDPSRVPSDQGAWQQRWREAARQREQNDRDS